MEYNQLISQLTPEIYLSLKTAIEIGKWPDGRVLTKDQKASCMEAMLPVYETRFPATLRVHARSVRF